MFARAAAGTVVGVDAHPVIVECHRANGLPGLALIGLARGAVKESGVRVRSAIVASEVRLGTHRLVINLLPAELPKEASALDLALAIALLAVNGVIPMEALAKRRFYGELSLGGALEPVRGAILMADLARREGDTELLVPMQNANEAAVIPGIRVLGVASLAQLIAYLRGEAVLSPTVSSTLPAEGLHAGCFSDVCGQTHAKRALEIAAAGDHNILMIGPPGSGKTMLARRLPGILPALESEESIEVTRIHSTTQSMRDYSLVCERPFRAPHHTASEVALCGGGSIPRPGEITLAHRGVLFLDEFPEFSRRALESLREPLEEGSIHISRAAMSLSFPARVMLVAAMNPCPCGYFSEREERKSRPCMCTYEQILRYRSRLSGPLLDRIDLHVNVQAISYREMARPEKAEASANIRTRVVNARAVQHARFGHHRTNASMDPNELRKYVVLTDSGMHAIEQAMDKHGLSSRAIGRILKVARTIADLHASEAVRSEHVIEAVGLRLLDRSSAPLHTHRSGAGYI